MNTPKETRILLGVTGGIAAYKSCELTRLLVQAGYRVQVVMTPEATAFVTPLTLQALSGQPVRVELLDPAGESAMSHINLARDHELILVAPATAHFLARLRAGWADDLLTTLCLAAEVPIVVVPAMNQAMWSDAATQHNLALLRERKVLLFGPDSGEQACGDIGPGRMLEPQAIAELAAAQFASGALAGVKVTITAGPTREAIDPVRYLSNHSSGKMGYALAQAAMEAGAAVTLISGPVALTPPERVKLVKVESAQQMLDASLADPGEIFIGVAAVADYRPAQVAGSKIKKQADTLTLELVRNPDILATVAQLKPKPFCVGFAAETDQLADYAKAKRKSKGIPLLAANLAQYAFGRDDNALTLFDDQGEHVLPRTSKVELARQLVRHIAGMLGARSR